MNKKDYIFKQLGLYYNPFSLYQDPWGTLVTGNLNKAILIKILSNWYYDGWELPRLSTDGDVLVELCFGRRG